MVEDRVGTLVGRLVGDLVGTLVGKRVGRSVGDRDGKDVGEGQKLLQTVKSFPVQHRSLFLHS